MSRKPKPPEPKKPRNGRGQRQKGDSFERECVVLLMSHGIYAERVPLSGATKGGSFEGDVRATIANSEWKIECKRRKASFGTLYKWLEGNDALLIRDDKTEPLVVLSAARFGVLFGEKW